MLLLVPCVDSCFGVLVPLILVFPSPVSLSSHFLALLPVMDTTSIIQRETDEASARHIAHDVLPQPVVAISPGLAAKREDMISNHILIARDEDGGYPVTPDGRKQFSAPSLVF